jgi:short-subunit dehydrogenase
LPVSESELKHMPGAEQVAKYCWDFIKKKKVVIIYGWKNKILVFLARIMPVCFLGMAIGNLKRKKLRYRKICL